MTPIQTVAPLTLHTWVISSADASPRTHKGEELSGRTSILRSVPTYETVMLPHASQTKLKSFVLSGFLLLID